MDSVVGDAHVQDCRDVLAKDLRDVQQGTQDAAGCSMEKFQIKYQRGTRDEL